MDNLPKTLNVYIINDGPFYFAQGVEIDYASQGDSMSQVTDRFTKGLEATLALYQQRGNFKVLESTPDTVIADVKRNAQHGFPTTQHKTVLGIEIALHACE